jgi:hypothetical protein
VDGIFAGDHVGDGASLGGLLARGGCFWCHCYRSEPSQLLQIDMIKISELTEESCAGGDVEGLFNQWWFSVSNFARYG